MFDIDVLANRLEQLEAKVAGHEDTVSLVNQHELKIVDQLKKEYAELIEDHNKMQLIQVGKDTNIRAYMPRSCFELKATNPNAQSGVYSIDPDGQIRADPSI